MKSVQEILFNKICCEPLQALADGWAANLKVAKISKTGLKTGKSLPQIYVQEWAGYSQKGLWWDQLLLAVREQLEWWSWIQSVWATIALHKQCFEI